MLTLVIGLWALGALMLLSAVACFTVDQIRTGQRFRRKIPMLPIGAMGAVLGFVGVIIGVASRQD